MKIVPGKAPRRASTDPGAAKTRKKPHDALKAERDALIVENTRLRSECAEYRRAVLALMKEDVDFDRAELLKLAGRRPTLQEFVHGLGK